MSTTSFIPLCCNCNEDIIQAKGGVVLSCSDFLCTHCFNEDIKQCPNCNKIGIRSVNLFSNDIPVQVIQNMSDVTKQLEIIHNIFSFQIKHYKLTIKRLSENRIQKDQIFNSNIRDKEMDSSFEINKRLRPISARSIDKQNLTSQHTTECSKETNLKLGNPPLFQAPLFKTMNHNPPIQASSPYPLEVKRQTIANAKISNINEVNTSNNLNKRPQSGDSDASILSLSTVRSQSANDIISIKSGVSSNQNPSIGMWMKSKMDSYQPTSSSVKSSNIIRQPSPSQNLSQHSMSTQFINQQSLQDQMLSKPYSQRPTQAPKSPSSTAGLPITPTRIRSPHTPMVRTPTRSNAHLTHQQQTGMHQYTDGTRYY